MLWILDMYIFYILNECTTQYKKLKLIQRLILNTKVGCPCVVNSLGILSLVQRLLIVVLAADHCYQRQEMEVCLVDPELFHIDVVDLIYTHGITEIITNCCQLG